jgi:integrase
MLDNRSLSAIYRDLYEPKKLAFSAQSTKSQYRITLAKLAEFLGREPTLDDLTDATVTAFMAWRIAAGRAARTGNKGRDNLCAIWRFAARKGLIDRWPDVDAAIEPERIPKAWMPGEIDRLFTSARQELGHIGGLPIQASDWWIALLSVLWDTGERIGAAVQVEWTEVDLHEGWITIRAETRKGHRREMIHKLHPETIERLKEIKRGRGKVFPWPFSYTYLWNRLNRILERADLPTDRMSKFHRVRKSVASHGEAAGINATQLLGHSGRRVTERYLDTRIVKKPQAADVLFRPGGGCD